MRDATNDEQKHKAVPNNNGVYKQCVCVIDVCMQQSIHKQIDKMNSSIRTINVAD